MKILDRAPMPLSKYALGGKLSQSAWIISLVCQLCQAYKEEKHSNRQRKLHELIYLKSSLGKQYKQVRAWPLVSVQSNAHSAFSRFM